MSHTPGPWIVKKAGSQNEIWSNRGPLAELPLDLADRQTLNANAALMAAAPDLYDACRLVKEYLERLETATPEDDPLREIRRKLHQPLHIALDWAMAKAEAQG